MAQLQREIVLGSFHYERNVSKVTPLRNSCTYRRIMDDEVGSREKRESSTMDFHLNFTPIRRP